MNKRPGYSPEVRERAVRMVLTGEHEHRSRWAAVQSVAAKIGCTPQTLLTWINKMEVDSGIKPGVTSDQAARMKELEQENRELKRANEILRKASAFFAQAELDRKAKYEWALLTSTVKPTVSSRSARCCRLHLPLTIVTRSWPNSRAVAVTEPNETSSLRQSGPTSYGWPTLPM